MFESFKVLIKEMQSLGLDVKLLSEDAREIEIGEDSIDISEAAREMELDLHVSRDDEHEGYTYEDSDDADEDSDGWDEDSYTADIDDEDSFDDEFTSGKKNSRAGE